MQFELGVPRASARGATLCPNTWVCSSVEYDKVAKWEDLPTCVGSCLSLELASAAFLKTTLLKAPSQFSQVRCLC